MDITIHALSKRFGAHIVLENFSAHLREGSITCLQGPSGCGKTTLLRLLLGLEDPDAGEITGTDVPKAAVFQENRLFEDFSSLSNVAAVLPGKADRAWIAAHLSALGLGDSLHAPARTLSGGMKRRVALVRAMLAPAKLVLLDEPFTGLDEATKKGALTFVQEQAAGKTLLLVTHDAEEGRFLHADLHTLPHLPARANESTS